MKKTGLCFFTCFLLSSLALGSPSSDLEKKPWFQALTETQRAWVRQAAASGFQKRLPLKVFFLPLDKKLNLYDSPATKKTIATLATQAPERNATGFVPEVLTLRNIRAAFWEVTYQGKEGWIERNQIRPDSYVLLKGTGPYVRDLFLNFAVAGERAPIQVRAAGDQFMFVVTYSQDYTRADEKKFAVHYDPMANEVTGFTEVETADKNSLAKPLASLLDGIQLELVKDEVGIGRDLAWTLKTRTLASTETLRGSAPAVRAGDFLVVDGSFVPTTSPLIAP